MSGITVKEDLNGYVFNVNVGEVSAGRSFIVTLPEKNIFSEVDIYNAGVPQVGDAWEGQPQLKVQTLNIRRSEKNRCLYFVNAEYSTRQADCAGGGNLEEEPWNRPALISSNGADVKETLDYTRKNVVGDFFDPPIKKRRYLPRITVTFAVVSNEFFKVYDEIFKLINCVNDSPFSIEKKKFDKRTCLMQQPTIMAQVWEKKIYYQITLNFLIDLKAEVLPQNTPDGKPGELQDTSYKRHNILIVNCGYEYKDKASGEKMRIMIYTPQKKLIPKPTPALLDKNGGVVGTAGAYTPKYEFVENYDGESSFKSLEMIIKARYKDITKIF